LKKKRLVIFCTALCSASAQSRSIHSYVIKLLWSVIIANNSNAAVQFRFRLFACTNEQYNKNSTLSTVSRASYCNLNSESVTN